MSEAKEYFDGLESTIRQMDNNRKDDFSQLMLLENNLRSLIVGQTLEKLVLLGMKDFEAHRKTVLSCIRELIRLQKRIVECQVEDIEKSGTYLIRPDEKRCLASIKSFEEHIGDFSTKLEQEFVSSIMQDLNRCRQKVLNYNKAFIERRKREYDYLFKKDYLSLDEEQKNAVITDDKYNLVIAGAGAGKTETLITRIAYLIQRKPDSVEPNRILAIAYQNKDANEIEQRLHNRYGIADVKVSTFHKLGKEVLEKSGKKIGRTDIVDANKKHEIIKKLFGNKLQTEPDYYKLFLQYAKTLHDKDEQDFESKEESLQYLQKQTYFSINRTAVRSRAEKEIMDFFLTNKLNDKPITIVYEPDLPDFRPDFCIPEYDLFIEHWALNKQGKVPSWFGKTTEEYKKEMEWKKQWFAKNNKLLVETFTYEYDEKNPDGFLEILRNRVIEKLRTRYEGVFEFIPLTYKEVVEVAWGQYKDPADEIVNFVTIAKTYGISPEEIARRLNTGKWFRKQLALGNLAVRIYYPYQEHLKKESKIDFEDMINEAIVKLATDKYLYADAYDQMLIDEYQDISAQRYKLIKTLLARNPKCRLFCVGDDWQSIMGFSGSNLDFLVNFSKYFEDPAIAKISTNYRSVRSIVDAGADLIKNNGSCQVPKVTVSNRNEANPIIILNSPHKENYKMRYYEQIVEDCLARTLEYMRKGVPPKEILILNRFMRTHARHAFRFHLIVKLLLEKAEEMGIEMACDNAYVQDKIRVLTVHKSKGLEAKTVFILNVIKDEYGFPCEIEDPSIYAPARENYPHQDRKEEERRLFYVAMTRAKEDLIIYTWEHSKSEFLEEIWRHTKEERLNY